MKELGEQVTQLRKKITAYANEHEERKETVGESLLGKRKRCGLKNSTVAKSVEGLSEKEIRRLTLLNDASLRSLKKRRQRDLSIEDRVDIVHSSQVEYESHK